MKKIILLLLLFSICNNIKSINSGVLSKRIVQKASNLITKNNSLSYDNYQFFIKQYGKLLKDIDFLKLLNPNFDNDTIFILMEFDELFYVNDFYVGLS